jgi:hypothetical protein
MGDTFEANDYPVINHPHERVSVSVCVCVQNTCYIMHTSDRRNETEKMKNCAFCRLENFSCDDGDSEGILFRLSASKSRARLMMKN